MSKVNYPAYICKVLHSSRHRHLGSELIASLGCMSGLLMEQYIFHSNHVDLPCVVQTNLVFVALSLVCPPIEGLYMVFMAGFTMFCIKTICSTKVPNTRCIMGHDVKLQEVEMALICNLVDWAKHFECNLCLVDSVQCMIKVMKGLLIVCLLLCYKNKINDHPCTMHCPWFFTGQQWCDNRYQLSYDCFLFDTSPLLNLTEVTESLEASKGSYTSEALIQLHTPGGFLDSPALSFPLTNCWQGVADQNLCPCYQIHSNALEQLMEDINHHSFVNVEIRVFPGEIFNLMNPVIIGPFYSIQTLTVYLPLSVLMSAIIPPLGQVFLLMWRDNADAAVLGLFDAHDQDLFLVVCHKSSNYWITHMLVSICACHKKSILRKGFKGFITASQQVVLSKSTLAFVMHRMLQLANVDKYNIYLCLRINSIAA